MAERISPDSPAFKNNWLYFRKGFIPWLSFKGNPYRKAFYKRYEWVNHYSTDARLLDVPCGMGWGTSLIKGTKQLVGMDLAEDAVAEANQRYSAIANFHVGSMGELPFQDGSFDVVACLEGIEHVPKDVADQFLAESFRVLSAGGRLLISSPHTTSGEHSGNEFHIYEYPTEEIREKLTTHFSIEDFHQRNVDNLVVDYFVCQKS